MEQKKKKQVFPGKPHHRDADQKGLVEMLTTMTNRFQLSMSEEDLIACIKRTNEEVTSVRGLRYTSLGQYDEQVNKLLARFLQRKDYHTGFMLWGKSGSGKTVRLKAVYLFIQYFFGSIPELGYSVQYKTADGLARSSTSMESFDKLCSMDLLILDNLGYEVGSGENLQFAQSLIGELLLKRYDAMLPTLISSVFDIDNLGGIYGQRVSDIIRESYYVMELTTDFRREIIKVRQSQNQQNYET